MKNKLSREDVIDLIVFIDLMKMDLEDCEIKTKIKKLLNKLVEMRDS